MENNKIQLFNFKGTSFTVILINDEPHWVGKEICNYLELSNPSVALQNLKEGTQKKHIVGDVLSQLKQLPNLNLGSRTAELNLLTEAGVYKLVFKSRKPNAEELTDWISEEVLPKIRKTGKFDVVEDKINRIEDEKERQMNLSLHMYEQALKINPNDMLSAINYNQTKLQLDAYKQQKQLEEINNKVGDMGKRIDNFIVIGDRTQFVHEVNSVCRATGEKQSEIYNSTYIKLKELYGINLKARSVNEKERIQDKRINVDGKKPYSPNTLNNKAGCLVIADDMSIWNELGKSLFAVRDELLKNKEDK